MTNKVVLKKLGKGKAATLLNTPYDGFYQIRGTYKNDRVYFDKVKSKKPFPDDRREAAAREIAGKIEMPAPVNTGSRIRPRVTAYVVFFKDGIESLDLGLSRQGSTSVEEVPNALAVLMIKHKDNSDTMAGQIVARHQGRNDPGLYFFGVNI
ncbi:MAG: hypothetical protein IIB71_02715 [Proteobacteria bacterium]|nr:hypothetical protein [Pseudomonadota bacterium]